MKTIITTLRSCARDLEEARAQLPDNLEPSVLGQFDSVVERLKQCGAVVNDRVALTALIDDGLQLAGRLGEVALVVTELVKYYRA